MFCISARKIILYLCKRSWQHILFAKSVTTFGMVIIFCLVERSELVQIDSTQYTTQPLARERRTQWLHVESTARSSLEVDGKFNTSVYQWASWAQYDHWKGPTSLLGLGLGGLNLTGTLYSDRGQWISQHLFPIYQKVRTSPVTQ